MTHDFTMATLSQGHARRGCPRRQTSRRWTRRGLWRCTANGSAMRAGSRSCWWAASRWRNSSPCSLNTWAGFPRRRGPRGSAMSGCAIRQARSIARCAQGLDNSAVSIVYSGERPYSAKASLDLAGLTEVLRLRVIDRIREELGSVLAGRPEPVLQGSRRPVRACSASAVLPTRCRSWNARSTRSLRRCSRADPPPGSSRRSRARG